MDEEKTIEEQNNQKDFDIIKEWADALGDKGKYQWDKIQKEVNELANKRFKDLLITGQTFYESPQK
jgi:hypothetical protein